MGRELATTVILTDENGQPKVFNEGDEPSKKWADQIDNPKAWRKSAGKSDDDVVDDEPEDEPDESDQQDDDDEADAPPAKSAKVEVWKEYAESKGVELGDDATETDYQDAVAAL